MRAGRRFAFAILLAVSVASCSGGGGNDGPPVAQAQETAPVSTAPFFLDSKTRSLIQASEPSEFTNAVLQCAVNLREDQSCTFTDLPLIGMTTPDPTIEDIMGRVVVTHPWMAQRFRQLLESWPPELLLMTRAVTAVVISSEVRPSFYTTLTGAIYLDPAGMALTAVEEDTISTDPDPRIEDIQQFRFLILGRYVRGDDVVSDILGFDGVRLSVADLLFHELGHANDFFPPTRIDSIDRTVPIFQAYSSPDLPSSELSGTFPLTNEFIRGLAQVAFQGRPPTPAQLALTADDVAAEFPNDVANDYYNYSSIREDLAMAFEDAMMLHSFGISRDVAVVEYPPDLQFCDELIVAWGQRRRIVTPEIRARAEFAVRRILPELADGIDATLDGWIEPTPMIVGEDWCDNAVLIAPGPPSRALLSTHVEKERIPVSSLRLINPRHQKPHF